MVVLAVSDERADAHNSVVDVLRKLVAKGCPNVRIALADKIVCGCKPGEVGHSLQVTHDDACFHANGRRTAWECSDRGRLSHTGSAGGAVRRHLLHDFT